MLVEKQERDDKGIFYTVAVLCLLLFWSVNWELPHFIVIKQNILVSV